VKRHPALEQLSRDHHHALVVARALKRAGDAGAAIARDRFLAYWESDGREHFREEEEILLPACAGFIDAEDRLIARVLTDHVRIRHLADRLASDDDTPLDVLHDLGDRLERHVRMEERELFPLIEDSLPEPELRHLLTALSR
jgi:hemerythrin-like domain-containing protein